MTGDNPTAVQRIQVPSSQAELKIQIRGITAPLVRAASAKEVPAQAEDVALRKISEHLLEVMRAKGNHLVFDRLDVNSVPQISRELLAGIRSSQ
jgi:hypothetical protein